MESRRDKILDATATCLLRTGLPGLSTTAICAEAGISMGALYTHFKAKADILRALAERSAQQRASVLETGGLEEIRRALHTLILEETSETGRAVSRVDLQFLSMKGAEADFASVIAQLRDNDDFSRAIARLARQGELKPGVDPRAAAAALEGMLMGVKLLSLMGGKHAEAYGDALDLLMDFLAADTPASSSD